MPSIRKDDIVILADYSNGTVLEIVTTEAMKVCKIRKQNNQVVYVEERLLLVEKQCTSSFILSFSMEVINFLRYTLCLVAKL
jgi:hypothetical protein